MNITFENPDKVSGVLTFVIEEADYQEDVNAQLKKYRKQANIPGFRPGQAPMGMIKRQVGAQVKVDVINKLVGEKLYDYVKENKINMLGEPMPHLGEEPVDLDAPAPYTLKFDIAVAPEFKAELSKDDKIAYYNIAVDDKLVDQQIEAFASRAGSYQKVDEYQENDMLKGDLRELNEDGSTKEGGITVSEASMLPSYITVEDQKALFNGAKVGDIITFNPKKAYPTSNVEISSLLKISKEEAENVTADFSFQVTEISRYSILEKVCPNCTVTNRNSASYNGLPPGDYVFHLRSMGRGDRWSDERLLNVHIAEPWYNTWFAWLAYFLVVGIVVCYVVRDRKEKFQLNQRMKMEKQINDFRINFFTHVTHEFRTPLAIIQSAVNRIFDEKTGNVSRSSVRTAVRGTQRLSRLVTQLMEFRKINSDGLRLQVLSGIL